MPNSYRVQVYANNASFGPGTLLAEFGNARNIGFADYLNDVPEAFFTLDQDDPKITLLRTYQNKAHVKIYRGDDLVWAGVLGEYDASFKDAVFYAYGHLSGLHLLVSDWNMTWSNTQIDTIASDLWTLAKTTRTSSRVGWVSTGTIQAPVTTTAGATAIVLPTYKLYYKKVLSAFRELAVLSIGDTANTVVFEITPSGTFNFWKNRGTSSGLSFLMGGRYVKDFVEQSSPIFRRNDLFGIGVSPSSVTLRTNASNSSDITTYGRAQDSIFFSWVRDSDELTRILNARLARSVRTQFDVALALHPDTILPPYATGSGYRLSDTAYLEINRGITNIAQNLMISGYQCIVAGGQERMRLLFQEKPGA